MAEAPLPFVTRLWFAWVCFFRALFDGAFAARAFEVRDGMPALPAPPKAAPELAAKAAPGNETGDGEGDEVNAEAAKERKPRRKSEATPKVEAASEAGPKGDVKARAAEVEAANVTPALQLLALFQREGRLVDFLEQDVAGYSDADVGAAARVVHEGCRKALRQHAKMAAVRSEEEGAQVTIGEGYDAHEVKLVGNVTGKPPYKGVLRHRGWRLRDLTVPTPTKDHDATVIAPAEVEL